MKGPDRAGDSKASQQFSKSAGTVFGIYCGLDFLIVGLLLAHAFPLLLVHPILFFLAFIGPPALALVILGRWFATPRDGRSGAVLAFLLLGTASIAAIHLNFLTSALSAV